MIEEALRFQALATELTKDSKIPEERRSEYFARLSSLRKQIARIIPEIKTRADELEATKTNLDKQSSEIREQISTLEELQSQSKEELQRDIDDKMAAERRLSEEIGRVTAAIQTEKVEARKEELRNQLPRLRARQAYLASETKEAREKSDQRDQAPVKLADLRQKLENILKDRTHSDYERAKNLYRSLSNQKELLDDVANAVLDIEKARNEFTLWATAAFAAVVGAVIVLFFTVLILFSDIRSNVFTGDAAIQFVTIFSLVIAIILFGVLRILEGKELAALLGGLSGYILGRGTISRREAATPAPASRLASTP